MNNLLCVTYTDILLSKSIKVNSKERPKVNRKALKKGSDYDKIFKTEEIINEDGTVTKKRSYVDLDNIKEKTSEAVTKTKETAQNTWKKAQDKIDGLKKKKGDDIAEEVADAAEDIKETVEDAVEDIVEEVKED